MHITLLDLLVIAAVFLSGPFWGLDTVFSVLSLLPLPVQSRSLQQDSSC